MASLSVAVEPTNESRKKELGAEVEEKGKIGKRLVVERKFINFP